MSLAKEQTRDSINAAVKVIRCSVEVWWVAFIFSFMVRLECELNSCEKYIFRLPCDNCGRGGSRAATPGEGGARETGLHQHVPVQIPVQADGPGGGRPGRGGPIGEERERIRIDLQFRVTS